MNKKVIKLTESELQSIIKETVSAVLNESENIEEGLWNTTKSFMGQYGKRGAEKAQQIGRAAGEAARQGFNRVKQGYNNVKNDIQQTAQNARQDSSMKDMQKAFNNFKASVERFKANGGKVNRQLGARISGIDNMMNSYNPHF